jgi:glycosyltransferase involved in cell wall biosynthesis|tara:strand:- start:2176 stop:3153 length:978 start_codon:yes stop_codon:yes gene_type:complete
VKITIATEHDSKTLNGNSVRPLWEFKALKRKKYSNVEFLDNFTEEKISGITENVIHAQQLSARFLKKEKYISDIHGLEYFQSYQLSKGFPITSWKKWAFIAKSKYYEKLEKKIFQNALHLICAGESIYEKVKKFQNATIVRNAVFPEEFTPSTCSDLRIALVGPFLPGKINYMGVEIIKNVVKKLENIEFVFIGKTDKSFIEKLNFQNVKFLGEIENYNQTLMSCSVLFAPFPDFAKYLGSKNKFLEAASSQIPIVTTPSGAIDFNNELLCIGKTIDELVYHIQYLKDENIRKDLGKKLRKEIEIKHNAMIEVEKIIKIYDEILK